MPHQQPFAIAFRETIPEDMRFIEPKHQSIIRQAIDEHLRFTPQVATRNRKPLHTPILDALWELRCGPDNRIRVLYNVDERLREVQIVAIGIKENNRLLIRGEVMRP